MIKFASTNIAKKILANMEIHMTEKLEKYTKRLRYLGLSGHQFNMLPFLLRYGLTSQECMERNIYQEDPKLFDPKCSGNPSPSSNLIWELSRKKVKHDSNLDLSREDYPYFVRVLFNGEVIDVCKEVDGIPRGYCSMQEFRDHFVENFILDDESFSKVCYGTETPHTKLSPY